MKPEETIIRECKRGKRRAQAELYDRYASVLYALCLRYCDNPQDAEDCLHDGIVKIFDKIGKYSGKGSFEGWMKRIIIHQCIDLYRKKVNFADVDDEMIIVEAEDFEISDVSEKYIYEAICNLPPSYKVVFSMYAIEGFKHKEIAGALGISEVTSRSNYLRARKILCEVLKQGKLSCEGVYYER